ncbi:MAG: GPP34 family phosphoprotein [Opitutales bacterium]
MPLRLSEELLLIALDDRSGKLHDMPPRALELALSGALVLELAEAGGVEISETSLKRFEDPGTSDLLLCDVHARLKEEPATVHLQQALARVGSASRADRLRLFAMLAEGGVVRQEEHRVFFVLHERRYPVIDDVEEREAKARLRELVEHEPAEPPMKDVRLLALVEACGLLPVVFSSEEQEAKREVINRLVERSRVGRQVAQAIREIQQAIFEVGAYAGM